MDAVLEGAEEGDPKEEDESSSRNSHLECASRRGAGATAADKSSTDCGVGEVEIKVGFRLERWPFYADRWGIGFRRSSMGIQGIERGVEPRINFKRFAMFIQGYLIGNGATDVNYDYNAFVPFSHGMGLISIDMYEDVKATCGNTFWGNVDDLCQEKIERVHWSDELATLWLEDEALTFFSFWNNFNPNAYQKSLIGPWELYTARIDYTHDTRTMQSYHKKFTRMGYRVLVYSGDHDLCVPFTGTEAWVKSIGYKVVDRWRPWYFGEQVAGYTQGYDHNLTFLTIKGPGHAVPEYKPKEALTFYSRWLAGKRSKTTDILL
ncbi:Serine carboxypeptidase 1 [Dichanthelium oligosanthes]|uniref:Serine carboxypeptidase 1 n=1 Tax=Dichanthelium oligosanthes TaxID=888268 RepID=A0A1E5V1M4_9POAL|nr:Serine carboxypeptidase 1 [Dichanthelium oligosanthes]